MKNKTWLWLIFIVVFVALVLLWFFGDWEMLRTVRGARWFANKSGW